MCRGWALGNNLVGIAQVILGVLVAAFWLKKQRKEDVTWEAPAVKWLSVVFVVAFLVSTVFLAPYLDHLDNNNIITPPVQKFDTADYSLREDFKKSTNEVMELKQKLADSNAKLKEMDPKRQNLASARMSAEVTVRTDMDVGGIQMNSCGYVAISNGTNVLVFGHFRPCESVPAEGGVFKFTATCEMDPKSSLFGLPITGLTNSTDIQVVFLGIPELSIVTEGSITVVLNGRLSRKFTISRQVSRKQFAMANNVQPQMIQWLRPD